MFFLDYENIYKKKLDTYLKAIKQIHFVGKLKKKKKKQITKVTATVASDDQSMFVLTSLEEIKVTNE